MCVVLILSHFAAPGDAGTFESAAAASQLQAAAEAKLSAPLPPVAGRQQAPDLHLAVSACLWGCLQRTLAPNVFLVQLGDKFTRLMTQLLVRYDTWLQDVLKVRQQAAATAGQQQQQQQQPGQPTAQQQQQQQQQQPPSGVSSAAGAGGEVRSGPAAWVPDMPLDSAAVICSDADLIRVSDGP